MKIIKKTDLVSQKPEIITDSNGNIIQVNDAVKSELKLTKAEGISRIIDIDLIRKASMFSESIDIVKTNDKKYKEATLKATGTGVNKTVQITFSLGYDKSEEDIANEKNMIAVVNSALTNKEYKLLSCLALSHEVLEQINAEQKEKAPFINNYSKNDSFCCNPVAVHMLSSCSISIASEISPKRPVSFSIKKLLSFMQIETKIRVDTLKSAKNLQEIESIYPFTALKFAIIDEICESEGAQLETYITSRTLTIRLLLREQAPTTELRAASYYATILSAIASVFTPRENIRAKYGMPEAMIEE